MHRNCLTATHIWNSRREFQSSDLIGSDSMFEIEVGAKSCLRQRSDLTLEICSALSRTATYGNPLCLRFGVCVFEIPESRVGETSFQILSHLASHASRDHLLSSDSDRKATAGDTREPPGYLKLPFGRAPPRQAILLCYTILCYTILQYTIM